MTNAIVDQVEIGGKSISTSAADLTLAHGVSNEVVVSKQQVTTFETETAALKISDDAISTLTTNTDLTLKADTGSKISTGITESNGKIFVDDLEVDGNSIITSSGNLYLSPHSTGHVVTTATTKFASLSVHDNSGGDTKEISISGTTITSQSDEDINLNANGQGNVVMSDVHTASSIQIGNIVVDGNEIQTVSNGNINLSPHGTGSATAVSSGGIEIADFKFDGDAMQVSSNAANPNIVLEPTGDGKLIANAIRVSNILVDGRTLSTTNTDGGLILAPHSPNGIVASNRMKPASDLSIVGSTISGLSADITLGSTKTLVGRHKMNIKSTLLPETGDLEIVTNSGDIVLSPSDSKKVFIASFEIDGSTISLDSSSNDHITIGDANTSDIILFDATSGGSGVGIGTDSPASTLEVAGSFQAKTFKVDLFSAAPSATVNFGTSSDILSASFSSTGLTKTLTLTEPAT